MPEPDRLNVLPANAPLLRKLIQKSFDDVFAPAKRNVPGGKLQYTGRIGSTDLTVSVIFSALYAQMNWTVSMEMSNPNLDRTTMREARIPDGSESTHRRARNVMQALFEPARILTFRFRAVSSAG